ncbi:MAG: 30S ribosomal protein S17e [Nitrososphaerales archaeon]
MDRTRRLSDMILERHPEAFSADYEKNKIALKELALIPSKQLRNHIAGYIAKSLKPERVEEEEVPGEVKEE